MCFTLAFANIPAWIQTQVRCSIAIRPNWTLFCPAAPENKLSRNRRTLVKHILQSIYQLHLSKSIEQVFIKLTSRHSLWFALVVVTWPRSSGSDVSQAMFHLASSFAGLPAKLRSSCPLRLSSAVLCLPAKDMQH